MFDFFERRIIDKNNPLKELSETKGVSMIDSFSAGPASETLIPKYSKMILEAYSKQERLEEMRRRRQLIATGPSKRVKSR